MLEKYKHISFDLDGTLVHTTSIYRYDVVPKVIKQLGGTVPDEQTIDRFWFESGRNEIIRQHFGLDSTIFWDLFHVIDTPEKRGAYTKAYPDAEPALRRLKQEGKAISILTGAPDWISKMELEKLNHVPHDYFLSITSRKFGTKPDPESFFIALQDMAMRPEETVYIGNSNEDAFYAKNAGVDFIYLERKKHIFDLKDHAVAIIDSLDDLFNIG